MEKITSYEELLKRAIEKRKMGYSYREIQIFLRKHTEDEQVVDLIIEAISAKEDEEGLGNLSEQKPPETKRKLIGMGLCSMGIALTIIFWKHGFIAFFTPVLILGGLLHATGSMNIDKWLDKFN